MYRLQLRGEPRAGALTPRALAPCAEPARWQTMLMVCDGHGPAGADASEGTITTFLEAVEKDPVLHDCRASGREAIEETLTKAIYEAETSVFLTEKKGKSSGTTFNMVILCGDEVAFTANVGDSRSIIATMESSGKALSSDITIDHTVRASPAPCAHRV